jgi:hypothetical protein
MRIRLLSLYSNIRVIDVNDGQRVVNYIFVNLLDPLQAVNMDVYSFLPRVQWPESWHLILRFMFFLSLIWKDTFLRWRLRPSFLTISMHTIKQLGKLGFMNMGPTANHEMLYDGPSTYCDILYTMQKVIGRRQLHKAGLHHFNLHYKILLTGWWNQWDEMIRVMRELVDEMFVQYFGQKI